MLPNWRRLISTRKTLPEKIRSILSSMTGSVFLRGIVTDCYQWFGTDWSFVQKEFIFREFSQKNEKIKPWMLCSVRKQDGIGLCSIFTTIFLAWIPFKCRSFLCKFRRCKHIYLPRPQYGGIHVEREEQLRETEARCSLLCFSLSFWFPLVWQTSGQTTSQENNGKGCESFWWKRCVNSTSNLEICSYPRI